MQRIPKVSERAEQVAGPRLLDRAPVQLPATTGAEYQIPEQEQLMTEHLPLVRFVARRIHERLPQHIPFEDIYGAGVVGLMDALD